VVHETATTLAFFPIRPAVVGHTLVIPKAHVVDFLAVNDQLAAELAIETTHLGQALRRALSPDGMNVITSSGAAASQTVFHFHIHLVPRTHGDAIGEIWPLSTPSSSEFEDDLADLVRREAG
jgi:histidine triad (HIT) family protein